MSRPNALFFFFSVHGLFCHVVDHHVHLDNRQHVKTCCSVSMVLDVGGLNKDVLMMANPNKSPLKWKQQGSHSGEHWGDEARLGTQLWSKCATGMLSTSA